MIKIQEMKCFAFKARVQISINNEHFCFTLETNKYQTTTKDEIINRCIGSISEKLMHLSF